MNQECVLTLESVGLSNVLGDDHRKTQKENRCEHGADNVSEDLGNINVGSNNMTSKIRREEECIECIHGDCDDVVVVGESGPGVMKFCPLMYEYKKALCKTLGLEASHLKSDSCYAECEPMGKPKVIVRVCFVGLDDNT